MHKENQMFSSNKIIGILGGGQLGKMTLEVSNKWGIKIYILDPDENCPSKSLCNKFFQGDLMDLNSLLLMSMLSIRKQ